MRAAGVPEDEIALAADLQRRVNQHFRTGEGGSELDDEIADASDEDWFQAAVDAGFLIHSDDVSEPGSPEADAWIEYMDSSTLELLQKFTGPVFVAVGLEDRCTASAEAADEIELALQDAGNTHRVLRYPGAEHVNLVWLSNPESCRSGGIPPFYYPPGMWMKSRLGSGPCCDDRRSAAEIASARGPGLHVSVKAASSDCG